MNNLLLRSALHVVTLWLAVAQATASAGVVINEIFYNAPNDLDDLQWIEFHNASDQAVDLSGWTVDDGTVYTFPAQTTLVPQGFVVVALNPDSFAKVYTDRAAGPLKRPLKRGGERVHLKSAQGKVIDTVRYKDGSPWPASADGYSASLERISPAASGETAENWAGSPLPPTPKPAGTPGRPNASFSAALPPVVTLDTAPTDIAPGQALRVQAAAKGDARQILLLFRVLTNGAEGTEESLVMEKADNGRFAASIPAQAAGSLVRYRVKALGGDGSVRFCPAEHDLRPTIAVYVHEKWEAANIPFGLVLLGGPDKPAARQANAGAPPVRRPGGPGGFTGRGPPPNFAGFGPRQEQPRPTRGSSTFIHFDPKTAKTSVFDHISTVPRNNNRGFVIHFHKDHTLGELRSVNLLFEGSEWSLLAESLAYDVYRRAGSPAELNEFVRVWVDGRLAGHHLMVERVNRSFLRRNQVADDGNLYRKLWMGRDVIGQHEKKTNTQTGHEDVLAVLDQLRKAEGKPEEQWKVIQENFDVEQVATYFAVNMVLSHWDGFFNNYFAYHDSKRNKWMMFPWDQDKTWGYYDGLPDDQVFFDMPLTFGMAGDRPPGAQGNADPGGGFGGGRGGARWWRQGGPFSQPLLANPQFRKVFLTHTRDILERVYTREIYFPMIDQMVARLGEDAAIRAKMRGEDAASGAKLLARDAELLKMHLTKRRQFLLEQKELQAIAAQPKP